MKISALRPSLGHRASRCARLFARVASAALGVLLLPTGVRATATYQFTHLAGYLETGGGTPGSADGVGVEAQFNAPTGLAFDAAGDLFVADTDNHVLRRITPQGVVTTFVGLAGQSGRDDGTGDGARLWMPRYLAFDHAGNLYVLEFGAVLRKVTPAGVVTTVGGTSGWYVSASGLAFDASDNLYIVDSARHVVRRITPAGVASIFAGSDGVSGSADGAGTAARFSSPRGLAIDATGNLFVTDYDNEAIRKITPQGVVSTVASFPGQAGPDAIGKYLTGPIAVDRTGDLLVATASSVIKVTAAKQVVRLNYSATSPTLGLAVDSATRLYVATLDSTIGRLAPTGEWTSFAGSTLSTYTDAVGTQARFGHPTSLARTPDGHLFVVDGANQCIRQITPTGVVSTFPATDTDGLPLNASCLAADGEGNLYAQVGASLKKISPAGAVSTLAHLAAPLPTALATDPSGLLYAVRGNAIDQILGGGARRQIWSAGDSDSALQHFPVLKAIACDPTGNLYATVAGEQVVRRITPDGVSTIIAGAPYVSGSEDGTGAAAHFRDPGAIACDANGNLYVADKGNHTLRRITPEGVVTTLGGLAGFANYDDGPGSCARFAGPAGVAVAPDGTVYLAEARAIRQGVLTDLNPSRLVNLSVRSRASSGDSTLIVGFVTAGGSKSILVRALGPALRDLGVGSAVADPRLQLFDAHGASLGANDDWAGDSAVTQISAAVGAWPLASGSLDSALLVSVPAGVRTAHVNGREAGGGIALAEIYDADPADSPARLVNLSARSETAPGENVLTAGFVLQGSTPRTLLIRGLGPALADGGLSHLLSFVQLTLYRHRPNSTVIPIAKNGVWGSSVALQQLSARVGASSVKGDYNGNAALVVTLQPGVYSVQVTGYNQTSGVALVELYEVP